MNKKRAKRLKKEREREKRLLEEEAEAKRQDAIFHFESENGTDPDSNHLQIKAAETNGSIGTQHGSTNTISAPQNNNGISNDPKDAGSSEKLVPPPSNVNVVNEKVSKIQHMTTHHIQYSITLPWC